MKAGEDRWLDRWLPLITRKAGTLPVLELGCGEGRDSATLIDAGLSVVGFDLNTNAVSAATRNNPTGIFYSADIRSELRAVEATYPVVLASLSLHYYSWRETRSIVRQIYRLLGNEGLLLVRVNSSEDKNYGATGHAEVEAGYFQVGDLKKRFFTDPMLTELFAEPWTEVNREKTTIHRYSRPKVVWEIVLTKSGSFA